MGSRRRADRVTGRRIAVALGGLAAAIGVLPASAAAHGLVGPPDKPIPHWLFVSAAIAVLVVSFVALAALWSQPKLERCGWRPLPGGIGRLLGSRPAEALAGALGVAVLALVVWAGFAGDQLVSDNFAPTFVFIVFWIGLVPVSVVFGDVFRALNPWRAIARAVAWVVERAAGRSMPAPLRYPAELGRWPAVLGIGVFAWLELVDREATDPHRLATSVLLYSAVTFIGMSFYGIEAWTDRGEAFSVYFNLFSRISPLERRGHEVGLRRPLSGLATLNAAVPGTVPLLAVMIGAVTFDGASEGRVWSSAGRSLTSFLKAHGLSSETASLLSATVGLAACIGLVYGLYRLGAVGARSMGGELSASRVAAAFVHSLVPIAVAYVGAHYLTFLLTQGQGIAPLASDPLGRGWDLFGTADDTVDYGILGKATIWYAQVGLVVTGHVAGLTAAHDRALALYRDSRLAVRSQYWMLAVMVGFTTLALWLLAQTGS